MSQSESQKAAKARYNAANGQISVRVKKEEAEALDNFIKLHENEITKTRFIVWACNYFISRGELPPESVVTSIEEKENGEE